MGATYLIVALLRIVPGTYSPSIAPSAGWPSNHYWVVSVVVITTRIISYEANVVVNPHDIALGTVAIRKVVGVPGLRVGALGAGSVNIQKLVHARAGR